MGRDVCLWSPLRNKPLALHQRACLAPVGAGLKGLPGPTPYQGPQAPEAPARAKALSP